MNWQDYSKKIQRNKKIEDNWYIVGMDLGTTNTVVSYWNARKKCPEPVDISHGFGKIPMPSVIQRRKDNGREEWIVGEEAYQSMKIYPESTIRSIKREMGTSKNIQLGDDKYKPEELSAKIIEAALKHLNEQDPRFELAGLIVSIPYGFDDSAKKATIKACEIAGVADKLICLVEEPIAAAIAYNTKQEVNKDEKIMVFDFGGGTLDITIFEVVSKNNNTISIKVISEGGDAYHGGDIVDNVIVDECTKLIETKTGIKREAITKEQEVEIYLRSREAKERLSGSKSYRIPFTFCVPPFVHNIDKDSFEEIIEPFIKKTNSLTRKSLLEAYTGALQASDIDRIILEGGSSKMPWVKDMLLNIFGTEEKIYYSSQPALDISIGATYYAAIKMGIIQNADFKTDIPALEFNLSLPHDIGIEINKGVNNEFYPMIPRGTSYMLAKKSQIFTLKGDTEEEMTTFKINILEKINKNDSYEKTKLIGEVSISNLPLRPSGKTRIKLTITASEDGGIIEGMVEDLGFFEEYKPSGFKQVFRPYRESER
ncbi:MAG: uncharacterized protein K0R15_2084 [Clostridiales bacterium]|nr:uncharacterized protein [Clostridiales bacterium]